MNFKGRQTISERLHIRYQHNSTRPKLHIHLNHSNNSKNDSNQLLEHPSVMAQGVSAPLEQACRHGRLSDNTAHVPSCGRGRELNAGSDGAGALGDGRRGRRRHRVGVVVDGDDGGGRADGHKGGNDDGGGRDLAVVILLATRRAGRGG